METELQEMINKLDGLRDEVLKNYTEELAKFTAENGNSKAAEKAGILHDLDKHITNLFMELNRRRATVKREVAHA